MGITSPTGRGKPQLFAALLAVSLAASAAAQFDQGPRLLDLPGDVTVRYTPGSLDRAARLQKRFSLLAERFETWNRSQVSLVLLLLTREEWEASGIRLNYGLPGRLGGNVLVLGAWGDEGTVKLWERLVGSSLPQPAETPMRGSAQEVSSLFLGDLLGEVEGARMMLEGAGISGDRGWIAEVMAHAVVLSQLVKAEPARVEKLRGFYRAAGGAQRRLPMNNYRSGLSLADWLWFQGRFFEGAVTLMEAEGADAAKSLLKQARKQGGRVTAKSLLTRYSGLSDWLAESFTGPA